MESEIPLRWLWQKNLNFCRRGCGGLLFCSSIAELRASVLEIPGLN